MTAALFGQGPQAAPCLYCGDPEQVAVAEVYSTGEFILDACCDGMREAAAGYLAEDPKEAARWLAGLRDPTDPELDASVEDLCGHRLRRVVDHDGQLLLDWNLEIVEIEWAHAKAFVGDHHRHNDPPAGWRFGCGVTNGGHLIAVATVGRPVAKAFDPEEVIEVNRVCVREDVPRPFVWNACSLLYGWSAREGKRRGFRRAITYTRVDEPGTSLRAAGWTIDGHVKGRSWNTKSRPRKDRGKPIDKTRWARELNGG